MKAAKSELILIMNFGGQYAQLIARRVRECGVYCEIVPYSIAIEKIHELNPKGIVFLGGPSSVYSEGAPHCSKQLFDIGIPIFGICYGMQLAAYLLDGKVAQPHSREYGATKLFIDKTESVLKEIAAETQVWMSHGDSVLEAPKGFSILAHTNNTPVAAIADQERKIYGGTIPS